jgi:pSer/pThr/pTyr-binding forkhead associated (FHA) protein
VVAQWIRFHTSSAVSVAVAIRAGECFGVGALITHCLVSSVFSPRVRILRKGRAYLLGRDQNADFRLSAEMVSRQHASIAWQAGAFVLSDLGSKNGTHVNGEAVGQRLYPLQDGDTIWIGPFNLRYRQYSGDFASLLEEFDPDREATVGMVRSGDGSGAVEGFALGGCFSGYELLEVCQLLSLNEKEGVLRVHEGDTVGVIAFRNGLMIRARFEGLTGEAAVTAVLDIPVGRFEFCGGDAGAEEQQLQPEALMLEAVRRRDETAEAYLVNDRRGAAAPTTRAFFERPDSEHP